MHHHDFTFAAGVRVGILFGRAAVRGPAGMTEADGSLNGLLVKRFFQDRKLARATAQLDAAPV